jgi:hypothetical protein
MPATRFYSGAPFVIVPDWRTGIEHVRELLAGTDRLSELQAATVRWWNEVCSERATARWMADCLRSLGR